MTEETRKTVDVVGLVMLWLVLVVLVGVLVVGCKVVVPVDAEGQPTGSAVLEPSPTGETHAVTEGPDGTETPIELEVTPDTEAIANAITVGAAALPPPYNLIGLLAGVIPLFRKQKHAE